MAGLLSSGSRSHLKGKLMAKQGNTERSLDEDTLGGKMRTARQEKHISLSDMAARTGYDIGYISGAETGSKKPSEPLIRKYIEILDAPHLEDIYKQEALPVQWRHRHSFSYVLSETHMLKGCYCGLAYIAWISDSPTWILTKDTESE